MAFAFSHLNLYEDRVLKRDDDVQEFLDSCFLEKDKDYIKLKVDRHAVDGGVISYIKYYLTHRVLYKVPHTNEGCKYVIKTFLNEEKDPFLEDIQNIDTSGRMNIYNHVEEMMNFKTRVGLVYFITSSEDCHGENMTTIDVSYNLPETFKKLQQISPYNLRIVDYILCSSPEEMAKVCETMWRARKVQNKFLISHRDISQFKKVLR